MDGYNSNITKKILFLNNVILIIVTPQTALDIYITGIYIHALNSLKIK